MFSVDTYQRRRATLRHQVKNGVLLFLGNIDNPINFEHNTYPFRQDSTFLYYFGIQQAGLAALIDLDEQRTIVFGDELTMDQIVWMGRQETLREKCAGAGVGEVLPFGLLTTYLSEAVNKGRVIHYLPPYQAYNKILLHELLKQPITSLTGSVSFIEAVVAQRSIKEEQELEEIEKAVEVSVEMHLLALRLARPGMREREITNAIQHFAADRGCPLSYPPIVTVHGEILHNAYQQNHLREGQLLLNDSGAETALGYAADLTRTFPVSKRFTSRQREIYDIVHMAFQRANSLLRPGIPFKEVHLHACESLVEGLISIGLMKGDPKEAVSHHAHTLFFQCGLGHMMGLDVHDMEDLGEQYVGYTSDEPKDTATFGLKSLRLGRNLQTGFVLTVEPGIYFIPELIDMWQSEHKLQEFINYDKLRDYRDFGGVRIEDNFVITDDGSRRLGPELIHTADDIEHYKAQHA
ncbi:Xaa-Pro aminopeptidase [Sphingobacterium allocomposti]|uniref:Xaa-Pro aminopeptidase n=1 Tax=Sphingobacterium allocomposti TaxID=415956 RepID=A0A5S5DJJ3_9SPHI|nr:aminopeptidase P family protein [Sphingobacterium composti Yoo et al. 2007 non Ten et al. 2007]TYP95784.1 Xaa-Pro aminopeptidase [Sphingobacterium composti Yoo et al. 2007 non Ten et al. 2007]